MAFAASSMPVPALSQTQQSAISPASTILGFILFLSKRFGSVIGQQKLKNDKEPIGLIVHISKLNFTQHFSMIYLSLLNDTWNFTSYSSLVRLRSPYTAICTSRSTAWIQTARLIKKSIKAILFTRIPCIYHMDQWCNVYTISRFLPKQALDTHITSLYCVTYPILNNQIIISFFRNVLPD